jgi:restriction system protein
MAARKGKGSGTDKPIIDGTKLSLSEWLEAIANPKVEVFPSFAFPNDKMRNEYLAMISSRSDEEVVDLLRRFLIHSITTKDDVGNLRSAEEHYLFEVEQLYRMIRGEPAWEGLTWVIDLVRQSPLRAIEVLDSYFTVHIQALDRPYWWERLFDAIALIRARWIEKVHPRESLVSLGGIQFEKLVLALFKKMGYEVQLTQVSHDGGVDVRAFFARDGQRHRALIQCKCMKGNVGVQLVRELHAAVEDAKVPKGILVATSMFTPDARKWADNNPRLELIDVDKLTRMLNERCGASWIHRLEWYTRDVWNLGDIERGT